MPDGFYIRDVYFKKERETKGCLVYRQVDADGKFIANNRDTVMGSIYIQKSCLIAEDLDDTIKISIQEA